MNVRAAFRSFVDVLRGRWIRRTVNDSRRFYTLASVKPETITAALNELSATGYMRNIADIYDMMPATDMHILGVRRQLRAGVQGLEMQPVSASEEKDAKMVAEACSVAMTRPGASWSALVAGILEGYLRSASLTEVMWEPPIPPQKIVGSKRLRYWNGFSLVPQQRLRYNWTNGELLLVTDPAKPNEAIPVSSFPPGKFVRCQVDEDIPDFAMRGTYRSVLNEWFARLNVSNWEQMAIERYGMPIPVGKYATPDGQTALEAAMQNFGAAGMLIVDSNSTVEWGTNSQKELVHETFMEKSAERISVAFLGASQTATIGKQAGSLASARVHEGIRRDILFAIADMIAEVVRRDLFIPFVRENFGEAMVPLTPTLQPQFDEPLDLLTTAQAWAILSPMLAIGEGYARELTGIPPPPPGEATLSAPAPKLTPPPLAFPKPKAVSAAKERVKVPIPETPPAFGQDVLAPLRRLVETSSLETLKGKIEGAPVPGFTKSADLLAAEMLNKAMQGILDARANRRESA